jgi:phosphoenolpyruvate carboxylase
LANIFSAIGGPGRQSIAFSQKYLFPKKVTDLSLLLHDFMEASSRFQTMQDPCLPVVVALKILNVAETWLLRGVLLQTSDVLAVKYFQREARLMQHNDFKGVHKRSLRAIRFFETVADLLSAGAVMCKLLSIDWYRQHLMDNHNNHQEVRVLG